MPRMLFSGDSMKVKKILNYFSKFEKILWSMSIVFILISFFAFDRINYTALFSSLIGVTSLMLCAKGNPLGQILIIVFSIVYGIISFSFRYYGEMITYLGMSAPMAVLALISWICHPYKENKSEVKVSKVTFFNIFVVSGITVAVTVVFYFLLKHFDTANLIFSTLSVSTSFFAVSLTYLRSPYYAVAYALNDIVLIILWVLATMENISYVSMVICFVVFLVNDIYGFYNWKRMESRQSRDM